ncbi:MAG: hypothetical protein M3081_17210 [Gemmatimonadota bacterium]|nr:hypothetical protein [Gemmatimonadota bacterium]
MRPEANNPSGSDDLQFDSAIDAATQTTPAAPAGMMCSNCGKPIETHYFHADGKPVCAACKTTIEQAAATIDKQGLSAGAMARAVLFGFGGAIAGAAIYYGFVAITHIEWALIAIAVAWIVGKAVRAGSRNRGGLRYQILAVVFTYFALGLAYLPFVFKGISDKSAAHATDSAITGQGGDSLAAPAVAIDSTLAQAAAADSLAKPVRPAKPAKQVGAIGFVIGIGALFGLALAMPVLVAVQSGAAGIINVIIIAVGLRQAWRMNAANLPAISGPYRVGATT